MDEFIKKLDENPDYLKHEIDGDEIRIYAASSRKSCRLKRYNKVVTGATKELSTNNLHRCVIGLP